MESPAFVSSSLIEKAVGALGTRQKRHQQSHTRKQREDFLAAVAGLGSVAAVAKELGINRSTCQKWANAAGIRLQRLYTQADKDQFYVVLDRTRTISAAAKELGLSISTARNWAGRVKSGESKPPASPKVKPGPVRCHPSSVTDEFLAVLAVVGSVSVAVRELGLNRSTCFNWARAVGVVSVRARRPSTKQTSYLELRRNGASRKDAAKAVGASKQSSYQWDRQQTANDTTDVSGNTADSPYKQEVTTALAHPSAPATEPLAVPEAAPAPAPVPAPVVLEALERTISARYLSLPERERIADQLGRGDSMRAIARDLNRSAGSISREIERNRHPVLGYQPYGAHRAATANRTRPKDSKLAAEGELRDYVKDKLRTRVSRADLEGTDPRTSLMTNRCA